MPKLRFLRGKNPFQQYAGPKIRGFILDFDGTITNLDKGLGPFVTGYKKDVAQKLKLPLIFSSKTGEIIEVKIAALANLIGIPMKTLNNLWIGKKMVVARQPEKYGWLENGRIVAPAYADPMILSRVIAGLILDEYNIDMNPEFRSALLEEFFKRNYPKAVVIFKKGAMAFLDFLRDLGEAIIVTNSETAGVTKKLAELEVNGHKYDSVPVHGDAKKNYVNDTWTDVDEKIKIPGLERDIFARREKYAKVLYNILGELNLTPEEVLIIGDIFELDLVLPMMFHMNICLVPRTETPLYEIDAVFNYERGFVLEDINPIEGR